jgi:TPR repeat protein
VLNTTDIDERRISLRSASDEARWIGGQRGEAGGDFWPRSTFPSNAKARQIGGDGAAAVPINVMKSRRAAIYFGDADAQYERGRLYLSGALDDSRKAARWFELAATKGHCRAEVALGDTLSQGQAVPRQAARGLMWLTL